MTAFRPLALAALAFFVCAAATQTLAADKKLKALIAGAQRSEKSIARDKYRHPYEMLRFAGLKDTMTVVEITPGAGYWTEILAPYLKDKGRYIAVQFDPAAADDPKVKGFIAAGLQRFKDKLAADPQSYAKAEIALLNYDNLVPEGTADMILLCRNMHDFMGAHGGPNTLEPLFSVMYKALKPGGVLVIEDHRGDPKKPQDPKAVSGYVREDFAIDHAMKTGFRFLARSDILANPKDTKDYSQGVFFLPPGERGIGGDSLSPADKARAESIGESDRFLIKLEKPRP